MGQPDTSQPLLTPEEAFKAWANGERIQFAENHFNRLEWIEIRAFAPGLRFYFDPDVNYRRHVAEVSGGVTLPEPLRVIPHCGDTVWFVDFATPEGFTEEVWGGCVSDLLALSSGIVFDAADKAREAASTWRKTFGDAELARVSFSIRTDDIVEGGQARG